MDNQNDIQNPNNSNTIINPVPVENNNNAPLVSPAPIAPQEEKPEEAVNNEFGIMPAPIAPDK